MMTCKEVADLIASEALVSTGLPKRALVRLHLLMCRDCRGYAAQLRAIGLAGRDRWKASPADAPTLERLQSAILDRAIAASDRDVEESPTAEPEPPASQETDPH